MLSQRRAGRRAWRWCSSATTPLPKFTCAARSRRAGNRHFQREADSSGNGHHRRTAGDHRGLNRRADIDGILVQMPLPKQVDSRRVLEAVAPDKDADGFHPMNVGHLVAGRPAPRSCTPAGIMELLKRYEIPDRRPARRGARPQRHRRQAHGADAAARKRHRDHLPLAHVRICPTNAAAPIFWSRPSAARRLSPPITSSPGATVIDVGINRVRTGRGGQSHLRRRSLPHTGRRRASARRGASGRGLHTGPGRRRSADHRHADGQHYSLRRSDGCNAARRAHRRAACGKSFVGRTLAELGCHLIRAESSAIGCCARRRSLSAGRGEFGPEILDDSGDDRPAATWRRWCLTTPSGSRS